MIIPPQKTNAIQEHDHKVMKEELSTATGKLAPNKSEVQSYFDEKSIDTCRTAFKIRSQVLPDITGNFKNKFRRKGEKEDSGLVCKYCEEGEIMSQSHCLVCPA